ncbi:MAG: DUF4105 domain-containing protein [Bacteroidales bacterium]|nr:DUF4105 domain-containing protein [Bacteroidales bacterium]
MKKLLLLLIISLLGAGGFAQNDSTVANDLRISILTCDDGEQMYASFGHCAFRVVSPARDIDNVYNYGMFNYNQELFYVKFVRGFLNYHVSSCRFQRFCIEYVRDGRQIHEQVLNLDPAQSQALYDYLEWNCLEENRYYRYNFLEDNCATRIRDIIERTCGSGIRFADIQYDESFRDMIHSHLGDMPWFRFGVDLLMGLPVDRKADSRTAMFLPEHVFNTLSQSAIVRNGVGNPLVSQTRDLLKIDAPTDKRDMFTYISPSLVFWLLFAFWAAVTYYQVKRQRYSPWADRILLAVVGLFGILFVFMWTCTEHTVTAYNMNILWAIPSHIVAAFKVRSRTAFWQKYFLVCALVTLAVLLLSPVLPQQFDVGFYPIMCILVLRLLFIAKYQPKQ